jgi:hypothetical protein
MNEHPHTDLAWEVNELLNTGSRNRFVEQCGGYLRLRGKAEKEVRPPPLPFDLGGGVDDFGAETKPAHLLCECYAILAALHQVVCTQAQPINPAPQPAKKCASVKWWCRKGIPWAVLVQRAGELETRHRPNVEECLAQVRADPLLRPPPLPDVQREILGLLDGVALPLKHLATRLDRDPSRLHRDQLVPLMDAGLIVNDRARGGYYRPDAPPA